MNNQLTPQEVSDQMAETFFGVTDEASRRRVIRQCLIGAVEAVVLVPCLFYLRFGRVGPLGWGATVFFSTYLLLTAIGLYFRPRTEYHSPVAWRGDWKDRVGAFWLMGCAFGPFFGWLLTSGVFPLTQGSWQWLYGLRVFLAAAVPILLALPLTRYVRGKSAWIALPLLIGVTLLPVSSAMNVTLDLWEGAVATRSGLYLKHTGQTLVKTLLVLAVLISYCCLPLSVAAQQKTEAHPSSPIFKDVAEQVGLKFQHYNGMTGKFYLPEITGSGAALFDFDNDGDLDVFLVQGNTLEPNTKPSSTMFPWRGAEPPTGKLFRNDLTIGKDGRRTLSFTDVTERSGIVATGYGMGVAVGDINNDGLPDLYLSNLGSNQMFLNKGDGRFVDVTKESGTDDPRWSTSASFFDYDRDGWLDLMVVNYADFSVSNSPTCYAATTAKDYCTPRVFRAPGNRLFHNKGNGSFQDVTVAAGVDKEFGHGLGIVTADFNDDGWIDIYVANDGNPNQLWINQKNGTFINDALLAGAAVNRNGQAEAGMGVDAGDFDGNGTEDIFITHLMDETNTLYLNLRQTLFEDRTREAGLGMPGRRFTGFGTLFFDYDNDGWLDLFVANGAVQLLPDLIRKKDPFPLGQPNQLFRNDGAGKFVEVIDQAGPEFQLLEVSRGAAFGDVDNDGDTDVLVTNNNGPARLLLNQVGNQNHWLGLRLIGKTGRDMLGAQVEIIIAENKVLRRRVRADGSYLSANDPRVLVGLGRTSQVKAVRVRWPDATAEEWRDLLIDQYTTLKQGTASLKK